MEKIQPIQPKIEKTLTRLVRIPSMSGQEGKLFKEVSGILEEAGIESQVHEKFVVSHIKGGKDSSKLMIFHAHGDTVPVDSPEKWAHNPFGAEFDSGKLYGRGATDDKGNATAVLEMAIHAQELAAKGELPCDVMAVVVGMEEKDGSGTDEFAKWLVEQKFEYDHIAALITEPTSLQEAEIGCKGNHFLKLTATGEGGHSTNVPLQDNAVFKLAECVVGLEDLNSNWQDAYKSEVLGAPSVNPSKVLGDVLGDGGYSTIPNSAEQIIDLRTTENTHESALKDLQAFANTHGVQVEHVANPTSPVLADPDSNLMQSLKALVPDLMVTSSKATNDLTNLLTTIRQLDVVLAEKMEAVVFGGGHEAQEHIVDEFVDLSHVEETLGLLVQLLPVWANSEKAETFINTAKREKKI